MSETPFLTPVRIEALVLSLLCDRRTNGDCLLVLADALDEAILVARAGDPVQADPAYDRMTALRDGLRLLAPVFTAHR